MARAYPNPDYADTAHDPSAGEWHALRGELVALLDQVESRYGQVEAPEPAMSGLAQRVRHLRDQVGGSPESSSRRRDALRSVKRAVDRFNERDAGPLAEPQDDLTAAIAEIRSRQGPMTLAANGRRASDIVPDFRELGGLIGGMSQRLERLEGELKTQRSNGGHVREVASQVEQLTHVVELLAGAVGETGQVKRLETQIAALGAMIEDAPKVDLGAVNARLDDVSATVAKLAELQAQQMEREIDRETLRASQPRTDAADKLAPAMHSIEESVRNVYDRIDAIERNVALSSGDFERLTSEMAAFTQAMKDNGAAPSTLMNRIESLAKRLEGIDSSDGEVHALKGDIAALRGAIMQTMEPRFLRLESQIEALSDKLSPVDTSMVENQLKSLMTRMDDAGAQLDGLARLYSAVEDHPDFESLASLVAERTSEAMARKVPAPVAMFGPESLKSIEDRLSGLIRSAGKTPDYEALADLVATRTSEAVARSAPPAQRQGSDTQIDALEQRMTALLNTTGKDTSERLARLEAVLSGRIEGTSTPPRPAKQQPARVAAFETDEALDTELRAEEQKNALDSMLANLSRDRSDSMPNNPAEDKPLVDPGFKDTAPVRSALAAKAATRPRPAAEVPASVSQQAAPRFDPNQVERPPRPQSSFASTERDPFAPPASSAAPLMGNAEPVVPASSTSTFVAAARRAQRARQEQTAAPVETNSLFGRALARVMPKKDAGAETDAAVAMSAAAAPPVEAVTAPVAKPRRDPKPPKPPKEPKAPKVKQAPIDADSGEASESFLTRHRRPLLLAATLVAVSMLALNLVMQRMSTNSAPAALASQSSTAPEASSNPPASDDQSSVPPRVIDMIDTTAVGSINPGAPMTFSRAATTPPMPPSLLIDASSAAESGDPTVPPGTAADTAPETFELPPEALGPEPLRQAAADGDARAQFEIAAIYTEGRAVEQNYGEAAKWYERSAAQGFVPAQYRLGNLYEAGTGVEKDVEQARLWYQRAAEAGNRMAMHNLAALYAGGQLGDQQFESAAEWFTQAANRGMTDSQFNLGMLYARGLGVEQDFEQSHKWFSLAARSGDKDAAQARDDIAKSLTAEAVGRVNDTVKAWSPQSIELAANFAPIGTWMSTFDPGEAIANKDVVLRVQQALNRLGFDVGSPDGLPGPKTMQAIRDFERGTGMSESGKVNPRLLAVLGSQPV